MFQLTIITVRSAVATGHFQLTEVSLMFGVMSRGVHRAAAGVVTWKMSVVRYFQPMKSTGLPSGE